MDRLSPTPTAEPIPPSGTGGSTARSTLYGLLLIALAAGGWVRFNNEIATVAPWLAAPAQQAAQQSAAARDAGELVGIRGLLDLRVLPKGAEQAAVAGIGLPPDQADRLLAALKNDQVRLVQLPLFDAGAVTPNGTDAGRSVTVSTAGFSRVVRLSRQPVVVTLPINRVGTIAFGTMSATAQPIEIGAITINGPMRLPGITRGDKLEVGVAAE